MTYFFVCFEIHTIITHLYVIIPMKVDISFQKGADMGNVIKKFLLFFTLVVWSSVVLSATTVHPRSDDISYNLDLDAVASIFGESRDLKDFERKLNDPDLQISNLDLNGDGQVDYLRVVESYERNLRLVVIQAVIGRDQYQDVATIEVNRISSSNTVVQIVGDPYIYGPSYIVEPTYVNRPPIYTYFWAGVATAMLHHVYHSPYYWGYYPRHYRHWRPRPVPYYRHHVHSHINRHHRYHRTKVRRVNTLKLRKKVSKRDYAHKFPNRAFHKRPSAGLRSAVIPVKPHLKPLMKPHPPFNPAMRPRSVMKPKPRHAIRHRPVMKSKPAVRQRPAVYHGYIKKPRHVRKPRPSSRKRSMRKHRSVKPRTVKRHRSVYRQKHVIKHRSRSSGKKVHKRNTSKRRKNISQKRYNHR